MSRDSRVINTRKADARRAMKLHTVVCAACKFPFKTTDGTAEQCQNCAGVHEEHRDGLHSAEWGGPRTDCILCQYDQIVSEARG